MRAIALGMSGFAALRFKASLFDRFMDRLALDPELFGGFGDGVRGGFFLGRHSRTLKIWSFPIRRRQSALSGIL